MPDETQIPVQVDKPIIQEGRVKFGSWKAIWSLPPSKLKNIVRGLQWTIGALISTVALTDWKVPMKDIAAIGGIAGVVLEGLLRMTGVVTDEDK